MTKEENDQKNRQPDKEREGMRDRLCRDISGNRIPV